MRKLNLRIVALIFIGAALLMAGQVLFHRLQLEEENNSVAIALEYGDLLKVALLSEREPLELLTEAQDLGLTTLVLLDDQALHPDPELLAYVQQNGLRLVAQLNNQELSQTEAYRSDGAVATMAYLVALPNLDMLFFAGYEALGWPDQVEAVASGFSYLGLPAGFVEMLGEQKGLDRIMANIQYRMIRVHPGYPYETLEDMVRAVKERGVRLLFLKPFKNMGLVEPDLQPIQETADQVMLYWVNEMAAQVANAGFFLGAAEPFASLSLNQASQVYLCLGIIVATLWLIAELPLGPKLRSVLLVLTLLSCGGVFAAMLMERVDLLLFLDLFALLAAGVFPSLGLVRAVRRSREDLLEGEGAHRLFGMRVLLESSLLTFTGAFLTNALLSETIFLSGWHAFRGVKIALLAPVLFVLVSLVLQALRRGFRFRELRHVKPLRLVLAGFGFLAGGVYLLRSGNEVSSISPLEQMLRLNLEEFFGVRPRFKEFLLGHPATMLLGWSGAWRWVEVRVGLLVCAAVAQASLFNTFMHLHSPLLLGLRRSLWGLALGEVIGVLLLALLYWLEQRVARRKNYA